MKKCVNSVDRCNIYVGICVFYFYVSVMTSPMSMYPRPDLRPMSHLQFYRATWSREKIASVTWRVAQLFNSHATPFRNRAQLYSVQLCRENTVNADWSILVYATKLQCVTMTCTVAYCNFVAR